jgi:hypothetical protein
VFIGQNIDQSLIKSTLDAVTLNDKEWTRWEKVGADHGVMYRAHLLGHEVEEE